MNKIEQEHSLNDQDRNPIDVLAEEFVRGRRAGKQWEVEDFANAHPELADEIRELFPVLEWFEKARKSTHASNDDPTFMAATLAGQTLGDYELVDVIGRGGMGVIYRAYQKKLRRMVAIKIYSRDRLDRDDGLSRFQKEAEMTAALDHPNIVPIYEVGEHDGYLYFAMKLIDGGNFETATATLPLIATLRLVEQVARAIHYAHSNGILHRDLKPSNVLVDMRPGDTVKIAKTKTSRSEQDSSSEIMNLTSGINALVADFGLAKRSFADRELTMTGAVLGTPKYMSPEQARSETATPQTDVHGIGVILYFALTGLAPFRGEDLADTLQKVKSESPIAPTIVRPDLNRDLETICLKCLEKSPSRRYPTALDVADEIERFLSGKPIHARPIGMLIRACKWFRREPKLAALWVAGLVGIFFTFAGLLTHNLLISSEQTRTLDALHRLSAEQKQTQFALMQSRISQAQANRWSGRVGARSRAIEALDEAVRLSAITEADANWESLIRNEYVQALNMPIDFRVRKTWPLNGTPGSPFSIDFDAELERFAIGKTNGKTSIYSFDNNQLLFEIEGPKTVQRVTFGPNGNYLGIAYQNNSFQLWEIQGNRPRLVWTSKCKPQGFEFHPTKARLAIAVLERSVSIFDLTSERIQETLGPSESGAWIRYDQTGNRLALLNEYDGLRVFEGDVKKLLFQHKGIAGSSSGLRFSTDGREIKIAVMGGFIRTLNIGNRNARTIGNPKNNSRGLAEIFQIPRSRFYLSSFWGNSNRSYLWSYENLEPVYELPGRCCRVGPSGRMAGFRTNSEIGLWEIVSSKSEFTTDRKVNVNASTAAFLPDGMTVVSGATYGLDFWDARTGINLDSAYMRRTDCVCLVDGGDALISGGLLGYGLVRWPLSYQQNRLTIGTAEPLKLPAPNLYCQQLVASADGEIYVCRASSAENWIFVYRSGSSSPTTVFEKLPGLTSIDLSDNGNFLLIASDDGQILEVFDPETKHRLWRLEVGDRAHAKFCDSRLLVSSAKLGTQVFDTASWNLVRHFPDQKFKNVATNGKLVAMVDEKDQIVIRSSDLATKFFLLDEGTSTEPNRSVRFSGCGTKVIVPNRFGFTFWDLKALRSQLSNAGLTNGLPDWFRGNENDSKGVHRLSLNISKPVLTKAEIRSVDIRKFANHKFLDLIYRPATSPLGETRFQNPLYLVESGKSDFAGVPFQIDRVGLLVSKAQGYKQENIKIEIGDKFSKLYFLHGLYSWMHAIKKDTVVAKLTIRYSDGSSIDIPVRYGSEVIDSLKIGAENFEPYLNPIGRIALSVGELFHLRVKSVDNPFPAKRFGTFSLSQLATNPHIFASPYRAKTLTNETQRYASVKRHFAFYRWNTST